MDSSDASGIVQAFQEVSYFRAKFNENRAKPFPRA
jgi:hypothetical protein